MFNAVLKRVPHTQTHTHTVRENIQKIVEEVAEYRLAVRVSYWRVSRAFCLEKSFLRRIFSRRYVTVMRKYPIAVVP